MRFIFLSFGEEVELVDFGYHCWKLRACGIVRKDEQPLVLRRQSLASGRVIVVTLDVIHDEELGRLSFSWQLCFLFCLLLLGFCFQSAWRLLILVFSWKEISEGGLSSIVKINGSCNFRLELSRFEGHSTTARATTAEWVSSEGVVTSCCDRLSYWFCGLELCLLLPLWRRLIILIKARFILWLLVVLLLLPWMSSIHLRLLLLLVASKRWEIICIVLMILVVVLKVVGHYCFLLATILQCYFRQMTRSECV